jgi:hypothetical protein
MPQHEQQRQMKPKPQRPRDTSLRGLCAELLQTVDSLERAMAGDFESGTVIAHEEGTEPMLAGEHAACLRGRLLLLRRAYRASLQAVLDAKPSLGDDVVLVEVVRVCSAQSVREEQADREDWRASVRRAQLN